MSALATLLALLTLPVLCDAQFNLRPVIEPYSKWPCSDWTWQNCPQPIPEGGLSGKEWYELTRWNDRTYGGTFGVDGETPGLDVNVTSAQELYDALEDRRVARINVTKSFSLEFVPSSTYYDDAFDDITGGEGGEAGGGTTRVEPFRWPVGGYPISRDVTVRAGPQCLETTEGHCAIDVARATLFVVLEDGHLNMADLRLRRGGGRLGGFMFMKGGSRGDFNNVHFLEGRYFPDAGKEPTAHGGAVMIANADRTKKELVPPVDPDTGAVNKDAGSYRDVPVPGNITFTKCVFADNQVTDGNAGAAWVKTRPGSSGWVIFDECVFSRNQAPNGWGGAAWSGSGRVIFAACIFVDNAAMGGGALQMVEGGLIGGSRFAGNRATERAGGAVFFYGHGNGLVQECEFERNSAVTEAGAVFVYGRAIFYKNEFAQNAVVNGLWKDVYICTDGDCKGYPDATRAFYDPPYEPFAELYPRPPVL